MLNCINDDTDNTSTFSDIDFEEIETFEKEVKKQEICNKTDEIIDHLEQQKFTPCVIIDFIEGKFQRYEGTGKLRQLRNLFGTWQVDRNAIKEVEDVLSKLEYKCKALHSYPNLCNRAYENIKSPQSICCLYYENLGGHIHRRSGIRGKSASTCITEKLHDVDITKGLEFIGNLLIKIAQMKNNEVKKNILIKTFEILLPLTSNKITDIATIPTINISINYDEEQEKIIPDKPPSLFMIKFLFIKIFKENKVKKNEIINYKEFGHENM
ncbi:unnamed protein product [Rhizophagus irregularis]|nr:unnamed protein product [Rhizophagus irregularis]